MKWNNYKLNIVLLFAFALSAVVPLAAQNTQLEILNLTIAALEGEFDNPNIYEFESLKQACKSDYVSCNRRGQVVGLDFQFANLNGKIPKSITKLKHLEYANLEFNYLSGNLPEGIKDLKKLEQLALAGNFLSGEIPEEYIKLSKKVWVDLAQNSFKIDNDKVKRKLNITNQFNLEGCRSPDSIFLGKNIEVQTLEELTAVSPKNDSLDIKTIGYLPMFPGCENKDLPKEELKACAENRMLQFIYRNLTYPLKARHDGTEGMAIIQFVVLKNGEVADANVVSDPGTGCGNAGLWIVNRMNYICDKWIPGKFNDEAVNVLYTLPINFKLE